MNWRMIDKRIISILVLAFMSLFSRAELKAIETASQIIDRCAANVNKAASLNVDFVISASGQTSKCSMVISKERFRLNAEDMIVWYNGTTQWTYQPSSKELSITEPLVEELLETNPFAILNYYNQAYTCRRLSDSEPQVELVAKSKHSAVRKAVVFIDSKTYMPTKLIVTLRNGNTFTVKITSVKVGTTLDIAFFQFDKTKYQVSETNDLR